MLYITTADTRAETTHEHDACSNEHGLCHANMVLVVVPALVVCNTELGPLSQPVNHPYTLRPICNNCTLPQPSQVRCTSSPALSQTHLKCNWLEQCAACLDDHALMHLLGCLCRQVAVAEAGPTAKQPTEMQLKQDTYCRAQPLLAHFVHCGLCW